MDVTKKVSRSGLPSPARAYLAPSITCRVNGVRNLCVQPLKPAWEALTSLEQPLECVPLRCVLV